MSEAGSGQLMRSSAVMAVGTIFSRLSGYLRTALLVAALGSTLHADVFNLANTIPNMLYILLAGGVFNAVLVPQLVRTMKSDPDGGDAYAQRVVTLAGVFLAGVTILLVVAAPWVMPLFLDPAYDAPQLAAARESIIDFARLCLPQVFFYGMFVLVGQILNARGRFGPMMWAPIANNVVSIAVLGVYILANGTASEAEQCVGYSRDQELLLGLGSTLGIAIQFLVLVPYLRAAGFRFRPRWDFRGSGLGHTLRLGVWTLLFVLVNQIAYTVVVKLASGGTALGCGVGGTGATAETGTGFTIYSNAFLIMMVPHAVVTVSLATAVLPSLSARAAEGDLRGLARRLTDTMRRALAVVLPFAALLPVVAPYLARVVFGTGSGAASYELYVPTLSVFGAGLVLFTVHYLMLRGFYALEQTRAVFFVQVGVAATNVVLAVWLVGIADAEGTAPALATAYGAAYLVGAVTSYVVLSRRLGGLATAVTVRFLVRMLIAVALGTAAAYGVTELLHAVQGDRPGWVGAVLGAGLIGVVDLLVILGCATAMHITEFTDLAEPVLRRLSRRTAAGSRDDRRTRR